MGWLVDSGAAPLVLIGTSCYGFASIIYFLAGTIRSARRAFRARIRVELLHHRKQRLHRRCRPRAPGSRGAVCGRAGVGLIIGPAIGFLLIDTIGFKRLFTVSGTGFHHFLHLLFARARVPGRSSAPAGRCAPASCRSTPYPWVDGHLHGDGVRGRQRLHRHLRPRPRIPNPDFISIRRWPSSSPASPPAASPTATTGPSSSSRTGAGSRGPGTAAARQRGRPVRDLRLAVRFRVRRGSAATMACSSTGSARGQGSPSAPTTRGSTPGLCRLLHAGVVSQRLGFGVMWPLAAMRFAGAGRIPPPGAAKVFPDAGNQ